ncbi:unnamed protein product [Closterium sp. NIES-54]
MNRIYPSVPLLFAMACLVPSSSPLVASIRTLDHAQSVYIHPCKSLDKNHRKPFISAHSSWASPYQLGFAPQDHLTRKASFRIRIPDRRVAIRCSVEKTSVPADSPEATVAFKIQSKSDSEAALTVGSNVETRGVGEEEGERGEREMEEIVGIVGEKQGRSKAGGGKRRGRSAGETKKRIEGSGGESAGGKGCEEEEAVIVIAQVLMAKFGPQIVREELEEDGGGNGKNAGDEDVEGEEEAAAEEEKDGLDIEVKKEEAEAEAGEKGSPGTTFRREHATTLSSLLSLYRFFSSHLGISSPSTVASLLATHPSLLRSDPTSDFLPRVRLLQSFGIAHAEIVHISVREPAWFRVSLPQIQNTLEFLLAQGVRGSRLGSVLRGGRNLLSWEARSTNLDILVEKAGVPVDKLGGIVEKIPSILTRSKEAINAQLETLSAYLKAGCRGKVEADSTSTSSLKQRLDELLLDTSQLSRVILRCPSIFSTPPYRIAENIAILQSFTPPATPSIASSVLRRAPTILSTSKETLLAKLQFFVELVGEEATGRVVRNHPKVLELAKENLQGKLAVLADLIGQENAVRAVAQFPKLLASSETVLKESFKELVREVEEAFEGSGDVGNETQEMGKGDRGVSLEGGNDSRALGSALIVKRCRARQLVVDLVMRFPPCIACSWKTNMKPKVEYLKRDMGLSIMVVLAYPPFLGFSLDRRIRPRHVALVRIGYAVVAHEVVIRPREQRSKLGSVCSSLFDEVEGAEGIEWGAEKRKIERMGNRQEQQRQGEDGGSQLLLEDFLGNDESEGRAVVVAEKQLMNLEATEKLVCLQQFLQFTDKQFGDKFGVNV